MPFRRAAKVLGYIVPSVSPMGVWSTLKEAGEQAQVEAHKLKKDVFEKGMVPEGQKSVSKLYVEADEVWVRRQRGRGKGLSHQAGRGLRKRRSVWRTACRWPV